MTSVSAQYKMCASLLSQPVNPVCLSSSTVNAVHQAERPPSHLMEQKSGADMQESQCSKKYSKIQDCLESSISFESRSKVINILDHVCHLDDMEKLLLYLKLPTGASKEDPGRLTPTSVLPLANRKEQNEAFTFIKSHFEEHPDICMSKGEVYDEYSHFCEQQELRPLSNADFGKMMKQAFPNINTRRLGPRGQSKYFYGGLRKKQDFDTPTLTELEITQKRIGMDSDAFDSEIFKASCELICEWAEKLLDSKFNSVQSIAEFLVGNMFVNTKSVAAFTLISSLTEGKQNSLKSSPLFSPQPNSSMDKHKETNMLLHQKLQKNRQLQKQKEKAQSLKSEVEQQSSCHGNPEGLTPLSNAKKSVTPSIVALKKGQKIPSPSSSPLPERSPMKSNSASKSSPWKPKSSASGEVTTSHTGSIDSAVKNALSNKLKGQNVTQSKVSTTEAKRENEPKEESQSRNKDQKGKNKKGKQTKLEIVTKANGKELPKVVESSLMETENNEFGSESNDMQDEKPEIVDARTPGSDMETEVVKGHVKKLNFEDNVNEHIPDSSAAHGVQTSTTTLRVKTICTLSQNVAKSAESSSGTKDVLQALGQDALSKSTGELGLMKLLESKDKLKTIQLNKSMGFIEKSKNSLFVNQSKMAVKSAFVPFSQFQSSPRKDSSMNQSVVAIPVMIPSATNQSVSVLNFTNPANEAINVVTVTSVLSKMSGDTIVSSSQNLSMKQSGLKFAPIRPKASPNKTSPSIETKPESLSRREKDSRRVSAILKEHRAAKEQAEAKFKLQSDVVLSAIPMQSTFAITGNTLQLPQPVASSLPPVFIVNNQSGAIQHLFGQNMVSSVTVSESNPKYIQSNSDVNTAKTNMNKVHKMDSGVEVSESSSETVNENFLICRSKSGEHSLSETNSDTVAQISVSKTDSNMIPIQSEPIDSSSVNEKGNVTNETGEETSDGTGGEIFDKDSMEQKFGDFGGLTSSESVDKMWSETPAKIAKLNITSPYRPESACLFGRETPTRISRCESNLSRPESACSFGRETPSGSRKRKSSDHPSRQNFKRLNSTGEDITEDIHNTSLVLSPETDSINRNRRRTQSCTSELEGFKQIVHGIVSFSQHVSTASQFQQQHQQQQQQQQKSEMLLMKGLQSPDISSLEKDALIESFPNSSLLYLKPQGQAHKNSIGINALKQSKSSLDRRMREFLEAKARENSIGGRENKEIAGLTSVKKNVKMSAPQSDRPFSSVGARSQSRNDVSGSVTTDRGKPYHRPASAATVTTSSFEPSGLPADVADWVSENLEKRQRENQSEPDLNQFSYQSGFNVQTSPVIRSFEFATDPSVNFETSRPTSINLATSVLSASSMKVQSAPKDDRNTFTVPKAPHVSHPRHREQIPKPSSDSAFGQHNQRCQSLPTFSSPGQSPVSPLSPMSRFHGNLRASSMSPRATGQPMEISTDVLSPPSAPNMSPVAGSVSPIRLMSPSNFHGAVSMASSYISPGKEQTKPGGPYLRKIQHSLQMPIDNSQNQYFGSQNVTMAMAHFRSRESSVEIEEKLFGRNQFSDSGFHSADPSPISNSTPVSSIDGLEYGPITTKYTVAESPIAIGTDFAFPATSVTLKQSPIPQQLIAVATSQAGNPSYYGNTLRSSCQSAFVPIQGSHSDSQHVSPVKPTVTLPQTDSIPSKEGIPENLFMVSSQSIFSSEIPLLTQNATEPPPYELAVKQLKCKPSNVEPRQSTGDLSNEQNSFKNQIPVLTMFNSGGNDQFGPFASKLVQLSQQSKCGDDSLDLNSDLWMSMDLNDVYIPNEQFGQLLSVANNSGQSDENAIFRQVNQKNTIGGASMYKMPLSSVEAGLSTSVLISSQSAINNSVPLATLGNPIHSVLNIDTGPSISFMPHSGSTNQIADSAMMSSQLSDLDLMCNKPLFSITKTSGRTEQTFSSMCVPSMSPTVSDFTSIKTKNVLIGGKTIEQVQKENLLLENTESPESADNVEELPFSLDDIDDLKILF